MKSHQKMVKSFISQLEMLLTVDYICQIVMQKSLGFLSSHLASLKQKKRQFLVILRPDILMKILLVSKNFIGSLSSQLEKR